MAAWAPDPLTDEERARMEADLSLTLESLRLYFGRRKQLSDPGFRAILAWQVRVLARWVRSYREQLAR